MKKLHGCFGWILLCCSVVVFYGCYSIPEPVAAKWANVAYYGEDMPLLAGTEWMDRENRWWQLTFFPGGKLYLRVGVWSTSPFNTEAVYTGVWERRGNSVQFIYANGEFHTEGTYYSEQQRILGTVQNSRGGTFNFMLTPYAPWQSSAGSSGSSSSSSSSSSVQNVTKTYNGQIYYEMNGRRMSQPFVVQASSPTEAIALARSQWQSTNYNNYQLIDVAILGSY